MADSTPATVSAEIAAMAQPWDLVSTLLGGTFAMRAAATRYLPKHPAEDERGYDYRRSVSTLYEAFSRTVETLAGKPFAQPLKLGEDMPPEIRLYCDDIDLEGRDLQRFSFAVFTTALAYGLSHILVDYPQIEGARTLAAQRAAGGRPYFVHLDPRRVLGWRAERIAGVQTLTQLRMLESITLPDGEWGTKTIEQVRVLTPTEYSIYRQNADWEWILVEGGPVSIGCIPIATVYTNRTGFMTAEPPLMKVAHLNVEHWQSSSDQANILHVARVPILFASGFEDGAAIKVGAGAAVANSDPAARLAYVEHSGAAIEAGRQSLLDLQERMSVMGAELLAAAPLTARTATEAANDNAEANCGLAAMVRNLEDTLELALQFAAQWEGLAEGGTVLLHDAFSATADEPLDTTNLLAAQAAGVVSTETTFLELQRRGLVDEEIEWADEQLRLLTEAQAAEEAAETPDEIAAETLTGGEVPAAPAAIVPAAPAAPSFEPLLTAIGSLVASLGAPKPEAVPPFDLTPLIAAIRSQPVPVVNLPQITVESPAITINVPEQAASTVNIAPPSITVEAAQITVNVPEQPTTVNVSPAAITVEAPIINSPPINVVVQRPSEAKFTQDENGLITGATMQ